jgi:hypothetical protein
MLSLLFSSSILIPILLLIYYIITTQLRQRKWLSHLPWIGINDKSIFFPKLHARFQNTLNFEKALQAGYNTVSSHDFVKFQPRRPVNLPADILSSGFSLSQYSSKGQACVLPTISDDHVLLPPSAVNWIINQPDHVLSVEEPHIESLQSDYTFSDPYIVRNPTHHMVISRDLTRQLGNLTEDIFDELATSIDEQLGSDSTQWKEVSVFETVMQVVARTSNRIFVGLPLCKLVPDNLYPLKYSKST